eukprot:scaffold287_cov337-Pavlova_lutheri.AAC.105
MDRLPPFRTASAWLHNPSRFSFPRRFRRFDARSTAWKARSWSVSDPIRDEPRGVGRGRGTKGLTRAKTRGGWGERHA